MTRIAFAADAAADILRRITSGELEVHGILLRDAVGKRFRYILRGLENLPTQAEHLGSLPPLEPLRAVFSLQQLTGLVGIAQNAALAATLKRMEGKIDAMERRLSQVEARLVRLQIPMALILEGLRSKPLNMLKAARNAAVNAHRLQDRTALILTTKDAEQAAHDCLAFATHLARAEQNGIPVAFLAPRELATLAENAADAMTTAASMHIALGSADVAGKIMHDMADTVATMRARLARRAVDPELLVRRLSEDLAPDNDVVATGEALRGIQQWTRGRAVLIEAGLIGPSHDGAELEANAQPIGLAFEEINFDDKAGLAVSFVAAV